MRVENNVKSLFSVVLERNENYRRGILRKKNVKNLSSSFPSTLGKQTNICFFYVFYHVLFLCCVCLKDIHREALMFIFQAISINSDFLLYYFLELKKMSEKKISAMRHLQRS
jgi:hypothetical protein